MTDRNDLEKKYLELGNKLAEDKSSTFKNHCYWRIANDDACMEKWTNVVMKPFYKNASFNSLTLSVSFLELMISKTEIINELNDYSLKFRNENKCKNNCRFSK